jgi:hypothetical protein
VTHTHTHTHTHIKRKQASQPRVRAEAMPEQKPGRSAAVLVQHGVIADVIYLSALQERADVDVHRPKPTSSW